MTYLIRTATGREQWVTDKLNEKAGIRAAFEGYDGYVSVEFDGEPQFDAVKRQAFVGGFVTANGTYAVQQNKSKELSYKEYSKFSVGDEVIILDGVLKDSPAKVISITNSIRVEVQLLGKSTFLDLKNHQLKKIEKGA